MKAIQTEEERQKKRKRNTQIMGIILAVLMLGSTLGYAFSMFFSSRTPDTIYPNNTVQPNQPIVITYNGLSFALLSTMQDISVVPVNMTRRVSDYGGATLFIVSEDDVATQELAGVLTNYAGRVQKACYGPCASEDLPEKTCADNLIVVRPSVSRGVSQQQNCIFIEGDVKAVDAFLYRLFRLS